jgi:hypothetical protein
LITRPCSPRLIWRSPSRISLPMSLLFLAIFDLRTNPSQHVSRECVGDILRIQVFLYESAERPCLDKTVHSMLYGNAVYRQLWPEVSVPVP